jgi:hypothetical protein
MCAIERSDYQQTTGWELRVDLSKGVPNLASYSVTGYRSTNIFTDNQSGASRLI